MSAPDSNTVLARFEGASVSLLADVLYQLVLHHRVLAPALRRLDGARLICGTARTIEHELQPPERCLGPFQPEAVVDWLRQLEASLGAGHILVVGFSGEI